MTEAELDRRVRSLRLKAGRAGQATADLDAEWNDLTTAAMEAGLSLREICEAAGVWEFTRFARA